MVGILGGMGPRATVDFYEKVIAATSANHDQQHVRLVIWADPSTPDRTAALLDGGPSPIPHLTRGLRWLESAGADLIAMPCNTAHAFLADLRAVSPVPILDMIDLAVSAARDLRADATRIAALSTRGTRAARLYERAAKARGLEFVQLPDSLQTRCVDLPISMVRAGRNLDVADALVTQATRALRDLGAQVLVAGGSEIPIIAGGARTVLPVIDATQQLAAQVVSFAQARPSGLPIATAAEA